jgi:hypothetical protein
MSNQMHLGTRRTATRHVRAVVATAALLLGCSLTPHAIAVGDAVMEWNQIALTATVTANQGPLPQTRSMTIVQVAVHDAVNGMTGKHDTYLEYGPAPAGASAEAAAIAAAHRALVTLFPAQSPTLDPARAASLAARNLTEANPGIGWGESVANAVLAARANDGASQAQFAYSAAGAGSPGVWVPVGTAAAVLPGWRNVAPWVLHNLNQFHPEGPPPLQSAQWARDYREVQELGSLTSVKRTPQQTEIARFWLATPSAIWNHVARQILDARALDLSDTARALALMYLAASDAGVVCWDVKYTYNFWRPLTAIRNGASDGNPATTGDPGWQPLFTTPQHPEYISGHSTNSGAMGATLEYLFGDDPGVTIVALSPTNQGFARQWTTFSDGVTEVINARIYSGFHYRTSDEVGARVGRQVARFVFTHALR